MIASRLRLAAALGAVIIILVLIVLLFAADSRGDLLKLERDNARAELQGERLAHRQTVASYRAAARAAQIAAERNVARVAAEQAAITERTKHDYQDRLAAVDARLERVRAQLAARADLSSADLAPVSVASEAACRAYGGASCDELPAKLAIAERQAWNLLALRDWVRAQETAARR